MLFWAITFGRLRWLLVVVVCVAGLWTGHFAISCFRNLKFLWPYGTNIEPGAFHGAGSAYQAWFILQGVFTAILLVVLPVVIRMLCRRWRGA